MPSPKMAWMHKIATLCEVGLLGELTPEISDWIANSTLSATFRDGNERIAGFSRPVS
jgi:hypothetical protein